MPFPFENLKAYQISLDWVEAAEQLRKASKNDLTRSFVDQFQPAASNTSSMAANRSRMNQLDQNIDDLFAHLAPDEVDILAQDFPESTTRMITIMKIGARGSMVMDLMEDIEFKPVLFPEELSCLLSRNDVFLTTMGLRDDRWHVIYLSHLYRT